MRWTTLATAFAALLSFASANSKDYSGVQCKCDSPPCDGRFLNKDSLCECQYNAALFCWHRVGKACQSPLPQACGRVLPTPAMTAGPAKPTFSAPYEGGQGGLVCVEIGYCSRPTKSRTTITVTNENGTQIVTVAAGAAAAVGAGDAPTNVPSLATEVPSPSEGAPSWPMDGGAAGSSYDPYAGVNYPSPPSWPNAGGLVTAVPVPEATGASWPNAGRM